MPTFPQLAIESLLMLGLLLLAYQLLLRNSASFVAKRWALRLIPFLTGVVPLLPVFLLGKEAPALEAGRSVMGIGEWALAVLPPFSANLGHLLLGGYFAGVVVASFRLNDRIWQVWEFLTAFGKMGHQRWPWQPYPTATMSSLIFNWHRMKPEQKTTWANNWLPLHPAFGYEALLVEVLVVLNWWNPLAYAYRQCWLALFEDGRHLRGKKHGLFPTVAFWGSSALLALVFSISPLPKAASVPFGNWLDGQLATVLFANEREVPHTYALRWGSTVMPLTKFANPNGYSGHVELEITDFQKIINKEIQIFEDGNQLKPGILSMMYRSGRTGRQAFSNGIDPAKVVLLDRRSGLVFNDSLSPGDVVTLFGDVGNIQLSKVEFRIKDPDAGYQPLVTVSPVSELEPSMPYQIVARKGQRTLVKIDPDDPNAERLIRLYADNLQYEIVRIPGFRTNRHYLTEAESLASKVEAVNSTLTIREPDAYYLPEYFDYLGKEIRLTWGSLVASPSSPNLSIDTFLQHAANEPRLLIGEDTLEMVSFEVIIAGKDWPAQSYETYRTGDLALRGLFDNLPEETSIFFDKIVVKTATSEQRLLFPGSFAFHLGQPPKHPPIPEEPQRARN